MSHINNEKKKNNNIRAVNRKMLQMKFEDFGCSMFKLVVFFFLSVFFFVIVSFVWFGFVLKTRTWP